MNSMFSRFCNCCLLLACFVLEAQLCHGSHINVDDGDADKADNGTYIGAAAAPGDAATPIWNDITYGFPSFTANDLMYSDGSGSSGVDITVTGTSSAFGGGIDWQNIQASTQENRLTRDRAFNNTTGQLSLALTLSDLNPTSTYDLYLYTAAGYTLDFTVNGITKSVTGASEYDDGTLGASFAKPKSTNWIQGEHYALYTGLTGATALNATIAAGATPMGWQTTRAAVFPGLQLVEQAVPEPSSVCLAVIALIPFSKVRGFRHRR